MTHTPGPWEATDGRNNDGAQPVMAEDARICMVDRHADAKRGQGWKTECPVRTANARLIAAAPDLLAACERMARAFEQHSYPELQGIACDVFAAIAKARQC